MSAPPKFVALLPVEGAGQEVTKPAVAAVADPDERHFFPEHLRLTAWVILFSKPSQADSNTAGNRDRTDA
jgi:hypothetical protein